VGYSLVLKGGFLIDPTNGRKGSFDIAISNGQVVNVEPEINLTLADRVLDISGAWILPGIIDLHVHSSRRHGGENAYRMLARAGTCTVLDMAGPWEEFLDFALNEGAGLNAACLQQVRPFLTVKDEDPSVTELRELLEKSLTEGAIGLKLLGGHYPLTPEASRRVIEVSNEARAYVAFHAGSTKTSSSIVGLREAIELAEGLRVHIPHINSYCIGGVKSRALDEIVEALSLLEGHRNVFSESYLATINGTSGKCIDGVPESKATQLCLKLIGYLPTKEGMTAAIRDGHVWVNLAQGGENINITGPKAVESWQSRGTVTSVNFPINPPESRFLAATLKNSQGQFIVDALASDGGAHPRNVIVSAGMGLVKAEGLTIEEFVLKSSINPAKLLGCPAKGHLGIGADADITGVDPVSGMPQFSLVGGRLVLWQGALVGSGTTILTTKQGMKGLGAQGVSAIAINPGQGLLYGERSDDPYKMFYNREV